MIAIAYTRDSYEEILSSPPCTEWEKMSKSKGNVISVDEVVHGVATIDHPYELRLPIAENGTYTLIPFDFKKFHVWRDGPFYFTGNSYGKVPVFLCKKGREDPCQFPYNGGVIEQHENHPIFNQEWFLKIEEEFA